MNFYLYFSNKKSMSFEDGELVQHVLFMVIIDRA